MRRLLTIAHSYVVGLNRRLAHELSIQGKGQWEVEAVAPAYMDADLRPVTFQPMDGEPTRVTPVPAHRTKHIHVFTYGSKLRSILKERWDLVHVWEEPYILAGAQIARWTPRDTPWVFFTNQNLAKRYPPPFSWIEKYSLRRCAGWIACGESIVRALEPRGYDRRPHVVLPFGVDMNVFRPDRASAESVLRKFEGAAAAPVVGYLGRLSPEKGLHLMMRVLDQARSPWRAIFVGTGVMESELRDWSKKYGSRVAICTDVNHIDVPRYINAMDLLMAPSQTTPAWREQFGRMLIEAFSCKVPVIASDSGEIPYVVGDAGLIVSEADEPAWLAALEELLQNPHRREELGERGRVRASQKFAWPVVARGHLDFFEQILQTRAQQRRGAE